MIKYKYSMLMFPEPADVGGGEPAPTPTPQEGGEPTEPTPAEPAPSEPAEPVNPFDFDLSDDGGEETEETDDAPELTEESGYSKEELEVINEISDKYGVDKSVRSNLFKEFFERVSGLEEARRKQSLENDTEQLRKMWGKEFDSNVKKAGRFISRAGKALGWKEEYINSWKNPESMALAYDLARFVGERGLQGAGAGETRTPAEAGLPSKEDMPSKLTELVRQYQQAVLKNDRKTANAASDEHLKINRVLHGSELRHLPKL